MAKLLLPITLAPRLVCTTELLNKDKPGVRRSAPGIFQMFDRRTAFSTLFDLLEITQERIARLACTIALFIRDKTCVLRSIVKSVYWL